jgi:superfamily I DNA/RNA helicase
MLIKGAAGSGKTTTALLRLRQLCTLWLNRRDRLGLADPVRVLVLTFNKTLQGYIAELARQQVAGHTGLHLEVSTFGRWAMDLLGHPKLCDYDMSAGMLRPLLAGLPYGVDFLTEEVSYILDRFPPDHIDDYLTASRAGRGLAPRVDKPLRRRLIEDVLAPYAAKKAELDVLDWNDVAVAAGSVTDVPPWDVIIIDEAQDFSANQVRTVLNHLAAPGSLTFVMDAVQRVYPRYFSWKEVGVTIDPARIHTLKSNHRNTREIAAFARPLVTGLPPEDDGNLPDFDACTRSGPKPVVFVGKYGQQIDAMLNTLSTTVDFTSESVAFLKPMGGAWFDELKARLRKAGIPFTVLTRSSVWPTGPEAIALSTLHSAKGLEFDHVLLPGLSARVTPHGTEPGDGQLDAHRRLIAMGVGRARKSVMLGYKPGEESTIVSLLDPSTYEQVTL